MRTTRAVAVASGVLAVVMGMPVATSAQVKRDPGAPPVRDASPRLVPDADRPVPMPHFRHRGARPVPMPRVQPRGAVVPMPRVGEPPAGLLLVHDRHPR